MASIINATVTSPGGLVSTGDNTNELKIQTGETDALTVSSSQVVTFNKPIVVGTNTINAENSLGFRNRIINGDMRIDQRNAGASVTLTNIENRYPVDRWAGYEDTDGVMTAQRDLSAPAGFSYSVKCTTTTADASLGATQFVTLQQIIEGFNVADLDWGTANAKSITLSFWVRSSLTGTFGGAFVNVDGSRGYAFNYTISSADTWEYKTVTIAGDTTGTWNKTNEQGLRVRFGLGAGSTYSGAAGSWVNGGNYFSTTGAVSVIGTLNATWYITGVQLEVGSVATPFERRPYGTELSLCQRYYYRITADNGSPFSGGYSQATTSFRLLVPFQTTMRTSPLALEQTGTAGNYQVFVAGNTVCNSVPTFINATAFASQVAFPVASGLTVGNGGQGRSAATGAFLGFSAEL